MLLEKIIEKKYLGYTIGCIQQAGILILYAILYNLVLIHYVREGKYTFFGSNYMLIILISIFPIANVLVRKFKNLIGNAIGFALYCIVLIPIGVLIGGGH